MARFVSGDVVVVPFPFADLASANVRPALVLAAVTRGDLILCQITSQAAGHSEAVPILLTDFETGGGLRRASFALPHRVVTANEGCVRRAVGRLKPEKLTHVQGRFLQLTMDGGYVSPRWLSVMGARCVQSQGIAQCPSSAVRGTCAGPARMHTNRFS
ncbi:MAG: type II toxin-antitoxin system PemK/MazF family toxin [Verrucomicrobia bacterium]|jgi:mRNA interferase MazF|nr:type II toxin-antitoxin system PemK/MazF family toxin [Verrucomicrobiota bacterium]OQC66368.1 MAG: PemK-like protein [Verrucomicrobia bacterium ADurb.Bin006]MDI9379252.1 type II toxin-antitoxin system PemK/MazF family toxin [Verrucomicrobiota bacterium]NMD22340.1 hypothetical protein [Verrucomicrobiota bacterium]HOF48204.1 type II toxin-antitoxin system PemK/MazF family toxin [Verrucomicrobiota bacterium]